MNKRRSSGVKAQVALQRFCPAAQMFMLADN
jgi:hypothetical protein